MIFRKGYGLDNTEIAYLTDYMPKRVSLKDEFTKTILELKDGNEQQLYNIANLISYYLSENVVLTRIPSSDANKIYSACNKFIEYVINLKPDCGIIDGGHCLRRTRTVPKMHETLGFRDSELFLSSVVINEPELIKGKDVLVIDDIVTSGSSYEGAKKLLLEAGAQSVKLFAFGKTISEITIYPTFLLWLKTVRSIKEKMIKLNYKVPNKSTIVIFVSSEDEKNKLKNELKEVSLPNFKTIRFKTIREKLIQDVDNSYYMITSLYIKRLSIVNIYNTMVISDIPELIEAVSTQNLKAVYISKTPINYTQCYKFDNFSSFIANFNTVIESIKKYQQFFPYIYPETLGEKYKLIKIPVIWENDNTLIPYRYESFAVSDILNSYPNTLWHTLTYYNDLPLRYNSNTYAQTAHYLHFMDIPRYPDIYVHEKLEDLFLGCEITLYIPFKLLNYKHIKEIKGRIIKDTNPYATRKIYIKIIEMRTITDINEEIEYTRLFRKLKICREKVKSFSRGDNSFPTKTTIKWIFNKV